MKKNNQKLLNLKIFKFYWKVNKYFDYFENEKMLIKQKGLSAHFVVLRYFISTIFPFYVVEIIKLALM